MSPAAAAAGNATLPVPDILLVTNESGETIKVTKTKASRSRAKAPDSAELPEAANKVSPARTRKPPAKSAASKATPAPKAQALKASAPKPELDPVGDLDSAADQLLAAAESTDARKDPKAAKALASIKVGPKGVYTEDSIRVYLQEIGRIRLLRPDEEIELARKIADLLHLRSWPPSSRPTTAITQTQRSGLSWWTCPWSSSAAG